MRTQHGATRSRHLSHLGSRWRQRKAGGAVARPGDASAHSQRQDDRRKRLGGRKSQSWSLLEYTVHSRRRSRVCKFSPRFTSCPIIPVDALKDAQFPADLESFFDRAVVLVSPKLRVALPFCRGRSASRVSQWTLHIGECLGDLCLNHRISGATRFEALPLDLAEKRAMRERGMPALQPPAAWRSHRREPGDRGAWFQKASTGRYE